MGKMFFSVFLTNFPSVYEYRYLPVLRISKILSDI